MDPEYNLTRLGYPGELDTFTNLMRDVDVSGDPLLIHRDGRPVAIVPRQPSRPGRHPTAQTHRERMPWTSWS